MNVLYDSRTVQYTLKAHAFISHYLVIVSTKDQKGS